MYQQFRAVIERISSVQILLKKESSRFESYPPHQGGSKNFLSPFSLENALNVGTVTEAACKADAFTPAWFDSTAEHGPIVYR